MKIKVFNSQSKDVARESEKCKVLINYIRTHEKDVGLIYCSTKSSCQKLHLKLLTNGIINTTFHSSTPAKNVTLNKWRVGEIRVIVATSACGTGIDIPNIRYVVNYDMPMSLIDYIQQIGRAGRDGESSDVLYFYNYGDIKT